MGTSFYAILNQTQRRAVSPEFGENRVVETLSVSITFAFVYMTLLRFISQVFTIKMRGATQLE